MSRDPVRALDARREAAVLEQVEDARLDIERALRRAETADARPLGVPLPPAAEEETGRKRRRWRWRWGSRSDS